MITPNPDNPPYMTVTHYGDRYFATLMQWHPISGDLDGEYKSEWICKGRADKEKAWQDARERAAKIGVEIR